MYQALLIALENEGWNKTSLTGLSVGAYLMNGRNSHKQYFAWHQHINSIIPVTNPPANYSDVYRNGIIYQYIWEIAVENATGIRHPLGFSLIDASTGQILPNPPIW